MKIKPIAVVLALFALALPLAAQRMMSRVPTLSGVWHPVVGSGAAYEMTKSEGEKSQFEITIVGSEDVDGKTNFWMEVAMFNPRMNEQVYVKNLMSVSDNTMTTTRTIFEMPGRDPMELDPSMGGRRNVQTATADFRDKAELVGTETITVPAGTFTCQHYREKDGSSETWISDKVSPWGLVKTQDKDSTIILTRTIIDAKDHITGTPMKFDPTQMMRDRMGQGRQ
jgi:hypothetical protein